MNFNDFIKSLDNDFEITNEVALGRLRYWRDEELKRTDWTMISDATTNKEKWAEYRQALRDLPANTEDPKNPSIPVKP